MSLPDSLIAFLASVHPYDTLPEETFARLAEAFEIKVFLAGEVIFSVNDKVDNLYVMASGEVEITDERDVQLSILGPRNSFGERALFRKGIAKRNATVTKDATTLIISSQTLFDLIANNETVARFFNRRHPSRSDRNDLGTMSVEQLMTTSPVCCTSDTPIKLAAARMHEHNISSICVCDDDFQGIVTLRDLNSRVIVKGADSDAAISTIMTSQPMTLSPEALVTDVLHLMAERGIGHVPIVAKNELLGIVTQTDLTRAQALSSADLVRRVAKACNAQDMALATAEIPSLLVRLVDSGNRHEVVTRLITDIADTATRRLLALAQDELGPAPVPYLWLACGSQGRQEQTGVSDQDNCLIIADEVNDVQLAYFNKLAQKVSDGLDCCGYFYCPGDMMATNPRWCQPLRVWHRYFNEWIAKPDEEAQMLASVMFDLRPISGDENLFRKLKIKVLEAASKNSIFSAHMISNSLKHQPPLGLLRGLATIRSGEHRRQLDLKHNGVVPVTDLGRVYSLQGQMVPVNTRARLDNAIELGILSDSGGADLLDAFDFIADLRLEHQANQIKRGEKPGNYLDPSTLSDFERSHLRDAFVVVKTIQSAVGSGKGMLG